MHTEAFHPANLQPFPEGYGIFPYLIVKRGYALYQQLPIALVRAAEQREKTGLQIGLAEDETRTYDQLSQDVAFRDTLLSIGKKVFADVNVPCCVVFGPEDAIYLSAEGSKPHKSIPMGGTLLDKMGKPLQMNTQHFRKG